METLDILSQASHLTCSKCGKSHQMELLQKLSNCCRLPLLVNYYDSSLFQKSDLLDRGNSMWRYIEMLPLFDLNNRVTLGEGMMPILPISRLARTYGFEQLFVKDEGQNPTGSFKARGMSMAISKAKELGITECVVPTAGNAGGAMSAYCAEAGIKATVLMPAITPRVFQDESRMYGSELIMVDGLIDVCGKMAAEIEKETGAFNMSTLKEPYRLEGKKTLGYEIAEQFNWELPDVIVYPTGGGTGLIGIWKAFHELISMGWISDEKLPKMVVVQSSNCSPIVDFVNGNPAVENGYQGSIANGLAVPKVIGMQMINQVLKESKGYAISVNENQILEGMKEFSSSEGISLSPEGAAVWMALKDLVEQGRVLKHEKVLLLNTGSGYKSLELYQ